MILGLWLRISNAVKNGTNLDCKLTYAEVVTDSGTHFHVSKPVDAYPVNKLLPAHNEIGEGPLSQTGEGIDSATYPVSRIAHSLT